MRTSTALQLTLSTLTLIVEADGLSSTIHVFITNFVIAALKSLTSFSNGLVSKCSVISNTTT